MTELPPDARALGRMALDPAALDLEGLGLEAPLDVDGAPDAGSAGEDAGVVAERERLARQLRETRMQLALTQARLTALQNSATMYLGKTLVNAAKRPWPRGAQLPRDLYRMWKDRGAPGKSGGAQLATALAQAQLTDLKGTGGRFLSALTAPGAVSLSDPALAGVGTSLGAEPRRLVIAGALTPLACATLAPDAVVHPLLPHDADIMIDGTGADLVIIEAAALLPGSPWAYATDPAGADRGRRLGRLIAMARSLGKPVALVRNVPAVALPGLGWVASACDVVWDGGLGVQLARFNPVGASAARPMEPLYAGSRDPRESPAVRALLDQLEVRAAGTRSWRGLPELYRGNGVLVTASAGQAAEQRACGARVIGPIGGGSDAAAVVAQLGAARSAAPLGPSEVRDELREVFEQHATPVKLAALATAAGLSGTLVGGRQVTVLAVLSGPADAAAGAAALAASLLGQRLRPAEVIAGVLAGQADAARSALSALADAGIRVRVAEAASVDALAKLATSPWVAPWPAAGQPDTHLLDLACARECAQADAVSFGSGDYEFTLEATEPALARRELFLPGAPPVAAWGARGLRLFSIGAH